MTSRPHPCVILLAAGYSRRMGAGTPRDKLLLSLDKNGSQQILLADRINTVLQTGLELFLILPPETDFPKRWSIAREMAVQPLCCDRANLGMGESLATAFSQIPPRYNSALVLLADMPEITVEDIKVVADAGASDEVWRGATAQGKPGHPVRIPRRLFEKMARLSGDVGAQQLLQTESIGLVPLPDHHATLDLDTPDDWQAYRARVSRS